MNCNLLKLISVHSVDIISIHIFCSSKIKQKLDLKLGPKIYNC